MGTLELSLSAGRQVVLSFVFGLDFFVLSGVIGRLFQTFLQLIWESIKTFFTNWLHIIIDKLFARRHFSTAAVALKTVCTPSFFESGDNLRLYHTATIRAGVAEQLVIVILAIWLIVVWTDKVGIVHKRLFTVIAHKMLDMPRLFKSSNNSAFNRPATSSANWNFGLIVTLSAE